MAKIKYNNYNLVFTFQNGTDLIQYFTGRKCTDLNNMIDYCFSWIDKFGDKYGEIIEVEIYEKINGDYFLVYDNVMN